MSPEEPQKSSPTGRLASFPERSATSTTIASLVGGENEAREPSASRHKTPQQPTTSAFPYGAPYVATAPAPPHSNVVGVASGAEVAESRVHHAYRASNTLQCAALADCAIVALSILSILTPWSLLCIALIPFGVIGRMGAASYKDGWMLKTYMIYCIVLIAGRLAVGILFLVWQYYLDSFVEVLKILFQIWFFVLATKFREALRSITPEEQERLESGRVAVARQEFLVYV